MEEISCDVSTSGPRELEGLMMADGALPEKKLFVQEESGYTNNCELKIQPRYGGKYDTPRDQGTYYETRQEESPYDEPKGQSVYEMPQVQGSSTRPNDNFEYDCKNDTMTAHPCTTMHPPETDTYANIDDHAALDNMVGLNLTNFVPQKVVHRITPPPWHPAEDVPDSKGPRYRRADFPEVPEWHVGDDDDSPPTLPPKAMKRGVKESFKDHAVLGLKE